MTTTRDEIEAIRARHEAQSRHAYTWTHLDHAQCQADRAILLPLAERCLKAEAALDEAQARADQLDRHNEAMWEALDQALDDMRGEGQCVCGATKDMMKEAHALRAAQTLKDQTNG